LLVDGLAAEREQGITIDVAYRFFSTEMRKFIVADTPGHEQYTRNMVTGASTAELALILIDARKGVLTQTRRHTYLCHLLGVKQIVLVVNKMDLVGYEQKIYDDIVAAYQNFAENIGLSKFKAIPISAYKGDNVTVLSNAMPWYKDMSLIDILENIELEQDKMVDVAFRMPVQWVSRPNLDFRGFSGRIVAGSVRPGDKVRIQPSDKKSIVDRVITLNGDLDCALTGQSVTLTLKDEVDCSRGQIIAASDSPLELADQFEVTLIWMDDEPLIPGRSYYLKIGTQTLSARVAQPKYQINVNTTEHIAAKTLDLNSIGVSILTTDQIIPFTPYHKNRSLGSFILIDKISNATAAAGLINFGLHRAQNIHWQPSAISRESHANLKNQKPSVIWMTGLSGAGKSTIANILQEKLAFMNRHTFLLDGDNLRHGLNKDLGFTDADRIENIRRAGEVAKLMTDAGLIVIAALISPFTSERKMVRAMMAPDEFIEVFIDTPLSVAEKRDTKGLYAKARAGELKNFTGIDSSYEAPTSPEIRIDTTKMSAEQAADLIVQFLLQ